MFDRLEESGPMIGKLLDLRLHIYELNRHRPPIRIYYVPSASSNVIKVFEFEMKTSSKKQECTINALKKQLSKS